MARKNAPDKNEGELGFYTKALNKAERIEFEEAATIEGLDEEIALVRLILRQLLERYPLEQYPEKFKLQLRVANTLVSLIRTQYYITAEQKNLKEAIGTVLKDVALELGLEFRP